METLRTLYRQLVEEVSGHLGATELVDQTPLMFRVKSPVAARNILYQSLISK